MSAQEGTLANIHDICRGVGTRTIARRKFFPTANREEHTEGQSCFFAALLDHFSVHIELFVARKALLSLTVTLLLCFHPGILLVSSGSCFSPPSPDSTLKGVITAPTLVLQALRSHQSEASLRPKTCALCHRWPLPGEPVGVVIQASFSAFPRTRTQDGVSVGRRE